MTSVLVKTVEDVLKIALVRQPEAIDWVEPEIAASKLRADDADSVLTH
jgi:ATP-dependent Lon protease